MDDLLPRRVLPPSGRGTGTPGLHDTTVRGFARTPDGAGLAGLHIMGRSSPFANPDWESVVREQMTGPGRAAVIERVTTTLHEEMPQLVRSSFARRSVAFGWRVLRYNDHRADLLVANLPLRYRHEVVHSCSEVTMLWSDSDWKLLCEELPADTIWPWTASVVDSITNLDVDLRHHLHLPGPDGSGAG